jgi:hypothetical protein
VDAGQLTKLKELGLAVEAAFFERVARGEAIVTDGRGIAVPPDVLLSHGAILRIVAATGTRADDADA